jgi:methionyl-tRNA formyltransferase
MQMEAGLDTGPMLLTETLAIASDDTSARLTERLADLGGRLLVRALQAPGDLHPEPQPAQGITYAHKIAKQEATLDWNRSALELERQVRAFDPFPVAQAQLDATALRIWRAVPMAGSTGAEAGTVIAAGPDGIDVACGAGVLRLLEVQRPGARRMSAREFLAGHRVAPNMRMSARSDG